MPETVKEETKKGFSKPSNAEHFWL